MRYVLFLTAILLLLAGCGDKGAVVPNDSIGMENR